MNALARHSNAALVLGALLCVNPLALLLIDASPATIIAAPLAAVIGLHLLWRRWQGRLVVVYAVNLLVLAGIWINAEAIVRNRFHDYVMEDLYEIHGGYYHNRPHLQSPLVDKEYSVEYLTNRDGYRIGRSQDVERTVTTVDWLFLGDSYTQGAQVEFEDLYTTHLYRRFPDKVVLNAGVSGWGMPEALAFLRDRGPQLRPRVVFLQVSNFNDFMKVAPRRPSLTDHLMQSSEVIRLLLQGIKYENPTNLPLGRWVEPFYPTDKENRRFNVFYRLTSPEKERDLEEFARTLGEIATLSRSLGARLVLVQIPTKEQVSFRFLEEAVQGLRLDPRSLDLELPNRLVRRLADSLSVSLVDPMEAWRELGVFPFFEYDEHLNPSGHSMLADAVAGALRATEATGGQRILSTSYAGDRYPQFTGAGDSIIYHSLRDGNFELLQADVASWTEERLTTDDVSETHPVLIPHGGGLLFVVGDASSGNSRVWRADRAARRALPLDTTLGYSAIPAVFPDGDRVVMPTWGPRPDASTTRLSLLRLSDGSREVLAVPTSEVWRPAVSPDQGFIAFVGRVDGQLDLFELDLMTRKTRRLTSTLWDEWDPTYSPDGEVIAYSARASGNWDIFTIHRTDGPPARVTNTLGDEWDAQFSPDGRTLAFGGEYGLMRGIYLLPLVR